MASTLQAVFSLPAFRACYLDSFTIHSRTCAEPLPATCIDCQMRKVADGLLSGRYSIPRSHFPPSFVSPVAEDDSLQHPSPTPVFQEGIKPSMFKALIGKGHEEFATMRQQDAEEFFAHLIKMLRQQAKRVGSVPAAEATDVFKFGVQQRLQCGSCGGVRYRVDEQNDLSIGVPANQLGHTDDGKPIYSSIKLTDCLDIFTGVDEIEYRCPQCARDVVARKYVVSSFHMVAFTNNTRRTLFATFPDVLIIHAKKFQLVNWVPTKLGRRHPIVFRVNVRFHSRIQISHLKYHLMTYSWMVTLGQGCRKGSECCLKMALDRVRVTRGVRDRLLLIFYFTYILTPPVPAFILALIQ